MNARLAKFLRKKKLLGPRFFQNNLGLSAFLHGVLQKHGRVSRFCRKRGPNAETCRKRGPHAETCRNVRVLRGPKGQNTSVLHENPFCTHENNSAGQLRGRIFFVLPLYSRFCVGKISFVSCKVFEARKCRNDAETPPPRGPGPKMQKHTPHRAENAERTQKHPFLCLQKQSFCIRFQWNAETR